MFRTSCFSLPFYGTLTAATIFLASTPHAAIGAEKPRSPLSQHAPSVLKTRKNPVKTEQILVTGLNRSSALTRPAGQTTYSSDRRDFANQIGQSVADMVVTIPGVSFTQGNGPRDTVVSVRGSGDRQSYGLKNLQVLEDGFPMTQPDGTARADLIDPHAYQGVDVFEGPASTLYGN
ncbi:TonB-dependent receptor plug domain-containing protein, partial [Acetobacter orientalis]|uniref:TonB-dependent receptor plug domain-containing protein n=1 Tax=Acetobacter orientalis TaxID=146474 RepID=UPI0039EA6A8F